MNMQFLRLIFSFILSFALTVLPLLSAPAAAMSFSRVTLSGYKNIEALKIGDAVLSWNVETGAIESNIVTDTHIRPISEIKTFYKLTIGSDKESETLFVTGEHPFWVRDKQEWVTVDDIVVGAKLTNHQGQALSVQAKELQTDLQQTYNITVAGNNNYFAGKLETLVHNCNFPDAKQLAKLLGIKRGDVHKVKESILKDNLGYIKIVGKNPDIGYDKLGNVVLKSRDPNRKGITFNTGVPIKHYGE